MRFLQTPVAEAGPHELDALALNLSKTKKLKIIFRCSARKTLFPKPKYKEIKPSIPSQEQHCTHLHTFHPKIKFRYVHVNLAVSYITERKFSHYSTVCNSWASKFGLYRVERSLTIATWHPRQRNWKATEKVKLSTLSKGKILTTETLRSARILIACKMSKRLTFVFQGYYLILKNGSWLGQLAASRETTGSLEIQSHGNSPLAPLIP